MSEDKALILGGELSPQDFKEVRNSVITFVKSQLKEAKNIDKGDGGDYGIIPYTKKKSLLKPGAEKLLKLFGFVAKMELVKEIEDFPNKLVYYKYRCVITHGATGTFIADAIRSCNNREIKHAKKDVYDVANTIDSIAQKRALVAATVQATMASEIFDADVSDLEEEAPNRSVTKEEDPRRVGIFSKLYGDASRRGMSSEWLHKAAQKSYGIKESLNEMSNTQLEDFREKILEHYEEVEKGEKPKLKDKPKVIEGEILEEKPEDIFTDAEVTEVARPQVCFNIKCNQGENGAAGTRAKDSLFCSDLCIKDYEIHGNRQET